MAFHLVSGSVSQPWQPSASATTAIWPLSAAVSHTVTSANSPLLVMAMAVGVLPSGSFSLTKLCEVLLPELVIQPLANTVSTLLTQPPRP